MKVFNGKGVSVRWSFNFIKRTPELQTRMPRWLDNQRAKAEDPSAIQKWFDLVATTINQHGITEHDIYNFDETGFKLGLSKQSIVVTSTERKQRPRVLGSHSSQWVTVIAGINAGGWEIPPYILFKAKEITNTWFDQLPPRWKIGVSPNGWTTLEHSLQWIQHFHESTKDMVVGAKRLLVLDGHETHMSESFQTFCKEHNIITLCMPPHTSHILQPLDVGCFGPLKKAYSHQIQDLGRLGYFYVTKEDFLAELIVDVVDPNHPA